MKEKIQKFRIVQSMSVSFIVDSCLECLLYNMIRVYYSSRQFRLFVYFSLFVYLFSGVH